jgi:hypothetical protein
MLETLCRLLLPPQELPDEPRPLVLYLDEAGDRSHRVALSRPDLLLSPDELTVVGFCGQKRPDVDRTPLERLDRELIAEFPEFPDLLSYSTLQTESGDACNLVLFSRPEGIMHWATSKKHSQAVRISPTYYESIRLHEALLPGGVTSDNNMVLLRTKYYDYRQPQVWRAVRQLVEEQ